MAITTSGGSAAVTGTITNSAATAGGVGSGEITVFTTPNTANAIFIVNYSIILGTAAPSNVATDGVYVGIPGAAGMAAQGTGPNTMGLKTNGAANTGVAQGTIRIGPNTAFALPWQMTNGGAASAGTLGYRIRYDYVSVVIS
jgi:hypothetical protein